MQAPASVSELGRQAHNERQRVEVSLEGLQIRGQKLKATDKFNYSDGAWYPQEYVGYAIVSMLNVNPDNQGLSNTLVGIQEAIQEGMQLPHQFYMMPQASFHQTVANTLSGNRFKEHIIAKGLQNEYPEIIKTALDKTSSPQLEQPMAMQLIGVGIFGSAFGALGVFESEADWKAIMQLREDFYSNDDLNQHDIKRTRPFIAHITLGYIDGELSSEQAEKLVQVVNDINTSTDFIDAIFHIDNVQLRSYDHLAEFIYKPNYPTFKFCEHAS